MCVASDTKRERVWSLLYHVHMCCDAFYVATQTGVLYSHRLNDGELNFKNSIWKIVLLSHELCYSICCELHRIYSRIRVDGNFPESKKRSIATLLLCVYIRFILFGIPFILFFSCELLCLLQGRHTIELHEIKQQKWSEKNFIIKIDAKNETLSYIIQ